MIKSFQKSIRFFFILLKNTNLPRVIKGSLVFLLFFIVSCQSDDDTVSSGDSIDDGFWEVVEKGWVFEFTNGTDVFYNFNSAGCAIQDANFVPENFFGFTLDQVNENEIIGTSELSDSEIIFTRVQNPNSNCLPGMISETEDPTINFDHFWNIFNDYYAFFEARNIDWSQYESLRDQVTEENFYDVIEELAYVFEDGHVSIFDEENDVEINSGDPKLLERLNANLGGELLIESETDYSNLVDRKVNTIIGEYLGGNFEIDDNQRMVWGLINNDVGYIIIGSMEGYGTSFDNELTALNTVLDQMMSDLEESGVSKLVIDMRFNDGGFDTVALDIVSRFVDQERVSYFKKARLGDGFTENIPFSVGPKGNFQFTDDIVLLTSPYTISAAELFTLCMKDLPYVTIVGENTNGAFSTILTHILPNGAEVGLSNEIYSDAQGEVFEVVGIGPQNQENQVPFLSTLDFQEEKDSGIERALELLNM
ncbi:S41 family peptidase [Aquimarina spongiae]|uniref:Peptidase family S41 n=1 Tax=Aquimarina spongiae TaxID=570521 RepID=A0A1M6J1I9_9FLAO|nr:S41 family peptidase [Aquimarina spongiae]SHJ40471.1 Peptidase family S41 [Aquimarina spongiae]